MDVTEWSTWEPRHHHLSHLRMLEFVDWLSFCDFVCSHGDIVILLTCNLGFLCKYSSWMIAQRITTLNRMCFGFSPNIWVFASANTKVWLSKVLDWRHNTKHPGCSINQPWLFLSQHFSTATLGKFSRCSYPGWRTMRGGTEEHHFRSGHSNARRQKLEVGEEEEDDGETCLSLKNE